MVITFLEGRERNRLSNWWVINLGSNSWTLPKVYQINDPSDTLFFFLWNIYWWLFQSCHLSLISIFFFHLFSSVGGQSPHNIAVGPVIHWHESAVGLHVFPILIPPPTSLSTRSLQVFPVHQARALVSCIQPGLVICFTLDNIHVSMLFSQNIPPLPSPTESKILCGNFLKNWN